MGQVNGKYVLDDKDIKWFAENTELSEEDVVMRYDHFVQNYPDGKIPKEAFINMLEGAYKSSKRLSKIEAHGFENYSFKTYDLNGDGCIDFKEFLWVMYTLSDDSPRQKLELIFKTFDDNRDGIISTNEMKQVVKDFFYLLSKLNQLKTKNRW